MLNKILYQICKLSRTSKYLTPKRPMPFFFLAFREHINELELRSCFQQNRATFVFARNLWLELEQGHAQLIRYMSSLFLEGVREAALGAYLFIASRGSITRRLQMRSAIVRCVNPPLITSSWALMTRLMEETLKCVAGVPNGDRLIRSPNEIYRGRSTGG